MNWNRTRKPGDLTRAFRPLYAKGWDDGRIADSLAVTRSAIFAVRKRLGLPANITPRESGALGGVVSWLCRVDRLVPGRGYVTRKGEGAS